MPIKVKREDVCCVLCGVKQPLNKLFKYIGSCYFEINCEYRMKNKSTHIYIYILNGKEEKTKRREQERVNC